MDNDPDLLYSLAEWLESQHQNFPQITAERLRDRLLFDRVAVLLRTDDGLDLAGCVGWHPDGVRPVRRDDRRILNKLGGNGVRRIGSADRRALVNAGLLGNEAQTVIVAPLKHENCRLWGVACRPGRAGLRSSTTGEWKFRRYWLVRSKRCARSSCLATAAQTAGATGVSRQSARANNEARGVGVAVCGVRRRLRSRARLRSRSRLRSPSRRLRSPGRRLRSPSRRSRPRRSPPAVCGVGPAVCGVRAAVCGIRAAVCLAHVPCGVGAAVHA